MQGAKDNSAPEKIMRILERLLDRDYDTPAEISEAIGDMK